MGPGVGARGVFVFLAIPLGQAPSGGAGGGAAGEIEKVALMSVLRGSTPEALANATARLIVENPDLSAEKRAKS